MSASMSASGSLLGWLSAKASPSGWRLARASLYPKESRLAFQWEHALPSPCWSLLAEASPSAG